MTEKKSKDVKIKPRMKRSPGVIKDNDGTLLC